MKHFNIWKALLPVVGMLALQISALPVHAELQEYQNQIDEIVMRVNEQRVAYGLNPLKEASVMNQIAAIRANELITSYSHVRPDGTSCFTLMTQNGIPRTFVAENIAMGLESPEDVMKNWMDSTIGHRENILSPSFDTIGVGVAYNGVNYYWVQVFCADSTLTNLYSVGNFNGDEEVNSKDSAALLIHAAAEGAGNTGTLNELQLSYADLNADGIANASDAAMILEYAAYYGSGGTLDVESYFAQ